MGVEIDGDELHLFPPYLLESMAQGWPLHSPIDRLGRPGVQCECEGTARTGDALKPDLTAV